MLMCIKTVGTALLFYTRERHFCQPSKTKELISGRICGRIDYSWGSGATWKRGRHECLQILLPL